ncbi:unnamed protein product, partial [Brassica rapa subsp. narinosa]
SACLYSISSRATPTKRHTARRPLGRMRASRPNKEGLAQTKESDGSKSRLKPVDYSACLYSISSRATPTKRHTARRPLGRMRASRPNKEGPRRRLKLGQERHIR